MKQSKFLFRKKGDIRYFKFFGIRGMWRRNHIPMPEKEHEYYLEV